MLIRGVLASLVAIGLSGLAAAPAASTKMQPRVLMGDSSYCDSVNIRNGHIMLEEVCVRDPGSPPGQVIWDGQTASISEVDRHASSDWITAHSVLSHLSIKHSNLYWEGKQVDLGKVNVHELYEAFPWQGGILIYGRTTPRRGFFGSWPFKGHFIEVRDLEPYCAIYFDPRTLKGEDLYINGKVFRGYVVFPLPE